MKRGIFVALHSGKLTKNLVRTLGPGRHGDGNGLYLVVDPSGARRWIVRVTVKGQRNRQGKPLRTDFGLGGADVVTLNQARDRALEYRRMAKQGINPRYNARQEIPCFEEIARQVHIERLPTWKNPKHGQQWINTLAEYAFPKVGRLPVSEIDQREVLQVLLPIWTEKHETAKRVAQRMKAVLDVAKSKGFREGENPVTTIRDARVLPTVKQKVQHHKAMHWKHVPAFYAELATKDAMAAKALMFTCLTASRTSEVLKARWEEFDFNELLWTIPAERMKTDQEHRVPLTEQMLAIVEPLKVLRSEVVFEGQKRHRPMISGYYTALERTMFVETVDDASRKIWEANVAAHEYGMSLLRPGATCAEITHKINAFFAERDLLQYRTFGYGHSFGVLSHYYGREAGLELREDIDTVLEPGMVISMEPMLTIPEGQPGAGGYREHDILIITETGNENITGYPYGPEFNVVG